MRGKIWKEGRNMETIILSICGMISIVISLYIILVSETNARARLIEAKAKTLEHAARVMKIADEQNYSDDFKKGLDNFVNGGRK